MERTGRVTRASNSGMRGCTLDCWGSRRGWRANNWVRMESIVENWGSKKDLSESTRGWSDCTWGCWESNLDLKGCNLGLKESSWET